MTTATDQTPQAFDVETLRRSARLVVIEAAGLAATLHRLRDAQWSALGGVHSPATMHADPVGETATDGRRLRLRAEIVTAERVLADAARALAVARRRIEAVTED